MTKYFVKGPQPEDVHLGMKVTITRGDDDLEAARTLAATALETIPVTHHTIDAAVMLKYRPVVAYNGPWAQRGDD